MIRINEIARILSPLAAVALCSCVSVFEGTSQEIFVATSPSEATCTFEREGRSIGTIAKTPGSLVVRKNKYDIMIKCDKPGYEQASYVNHSGTSAVIAANVIVDILLTAGISSIVDSANGADNKYDSPLNITMVQTGAATSATSTPAAPPDTNTPATSVQATQQ